MTITPKQQVFINEYFLDFNATQAAIRAGYSENTARIQGHRLLTNDNIAAEIKRRMEDRHMKAEEALMLLADQAYGSLNDFVDVFEGGRSFCLNLEKAKEQGKFHLIKKLKYNAQGLPEIELHDPQKAIELIGKHLGLLTDKTEHTGTIDINVSASDEIASRIDSISQRIRATETD